MLHQFRLHRPVSGTAGRSARPFGQALFAMATLAMAAMLSAPTITLGAEAPEGDRATVDRLDKPALMLRTPSKAELQAVIRNEGRLIAVGQRGVAIYSDDDGASWTQAPTPVSVALTAVIARPDGVAVAVGHDAAILRSTDNGASWTKITDGRTLLPMRIEVMTKRYQEAKALFEKQKAEQQQQEEAAAQASADGAASADDAAAAGDSGQASDSGADDAPVLDEFALEDLDFRADTMKQSMEFGPAWPFLDVAFLSDAPDEKRILAVGAFGTAFLSEDSGESWELVSGRFENPTDLHLNNVFITKTGVVLIGSEQGFIFRSEPGAEKFEPIETFDGFSFFDMNVVPGTEKIVAYGFGDTYHYSDDDGRSWTSAPLSESMSLAGNVALPSGGLGIMGDGGQMFEIGPDGEKRRFRPIDTRKMLGDALAMSGSRVLFVSELGVTITDKP